MSANAASSTAWARALHAAALFAIDPLSSGLVIRSGAGPVRDAFLDALRAGLDPAAPLRRVPLGISDDRLLGGLDLAATLRAGRPVAERGLLAQTDGGVLLLAMAERLSPGAAARIVAAFDLREVQGERDGLTLRAPARFGFVALDEGHGDDERIPSALRDRATFVLDLGQISLGDIGETIFTASEIAAARARLPSVEVDAGAVEALVEVAAQLGVASLRGPILALRVARACCALRGATRVEEQDLSAAAALVLAPRATQIPSSSEDSEPESSEPEPTPETESEASPPSDGHEEQISPSELDEIVLAAARAAIPADLLRLIETRAASRSAAVQHGKSGASVASAQRGRPLGVRRGALREGRLSVVETLRAAAPWQPLRRAEIGSDARRVWVRIEDFRITRFRQRKGTVSIFAVDASGSSAMQRLAEVKGAIELLLADCYVRRDSVALVAFRGTKAEVILPPTRSLARARRTLAGLPGGGGTPLAAGVDAALALADQIRRKGQSPLIVLMTDGKANVTREGGPGRAKAHDEALQACRGVRGAGVPALAIDTAPATSRGDDAPTLALARELGARYIKLPYADASHVSRAVRAAAPSS